MRYAVDLAVFVAVFILGLIAFKSAAYALLAGLLVGGATEAFLGDPTKKP